MLLDFFVLGDFMLSCDEGDLGERGDFDKRECGDITEEQVADFCGDFGEPSVFFSLSAVGLFVEPVRI